MCLAIRVGFGGARRGEKASLGHEEAVSRQTQGDMVIEAAPAAALELGQADLLLEFAIVLLDPVAALDVPDEVLERRVGRQRTQPEAPVLGGLGVLNDQPFLGIEVVTALSRSDLNPARRKPPGQLSGRSFAPRDGAPVVRLPRAGQDIDPDRAGLDLDGPGAPVGGIRCGGRHDRGVALDPERIAESEVPQRVAEAPGATVSGHRPARSRAAGRRQRRGGSDRSPSRSWCET